MGTLLIACALVLVASPVPPGADLAALGPQVGHKTPGFRLPDQHGRRRTLGNVAGPRGTMVVFVRSADW